ncbi:MAG: hypothetical protein AAB618_02325 [Patescibacteria group bacterium]
MKTNRFFAVKVFAATLLLLAPEAQAYEVTDRHITRLSDTVTMYTLTYEFGFLNAEAWMPIVASKSSRDAMLGNQISSIILSTAPIVGDKYYVPMKKKDSFTLLVLEQHAVGKSKNSVQVNELPVTIRKKDDQKMLWTLQGEELKDFTVPKKK